MSYDIKILGPHSAKHLIHLKFNLVALKHMVKCFAQLTYMKHTVKYFIESES